MIDTKKSDPRYRLDGYIMVVPYMYAAATVVWMGTVEVVVAGIFGVIPGWISALIGCTLIIVGTFLSALSIFARAHTKQLLAEVLKSDKDATPDTAGDTA